MGRDLKRKKEEMCMTVRGRDSKEKKTWGRIWGVSSWPHYVPHTIILACLFSWRFAWALIQPTAASLPNFLPLISGSTEDG